MKQRINRFCAMLMMPFMVALNCPIAAIGANPEVPVIEIEITHDPVEKVTAGQRIMLEAAVEDESGVEVVRAYFKAVEADDYNFVVLKAVNYGTYQGILPAPANGAGSIDYLILVKNGNNQVIKTQTYRIEVEDDENAPQSIANNEQIEVYTELQQAPTEVTGFSDNITIDIVESAAKLGVVTGIYSTAVSSTSTAVDMGTIAASTGGISTTTIVIGAVVALAAVGGIAASGGSGGGGGGGGGSELTSQTILGTWNWTENGDGGTVTFYANGGWSSSDGVRGSWNLSGNTLTTTDNSGDVDIGTVSGNSQAFTHTSPVYGRTFFSR